MSTMVKKGMLLIVLQCFMWYAKAQTSTTVLDNYVQEAFKTNEGLQQQRLQLDQALNALKEAKSLYYPNISLMANYTRAGGGRTIDFPIGDIMNPVYSTLNQLTQSNNFPTIQNASILLNPDNFYDAKFRTSLPLINAEIYYNERIKKVQIGEKDAALAVYKRELVKSVKEAYYQYYMAEKAVGIYENALSLVKENVRVNTSLVRNGVKNNTVLVRAQSEQQKIEAAYEQAKNNRKNAQLYFNFLLNRNADADIIIDSAYIESDAALNMRLDAVANGREELTQLRSAIQAYELNTQMKKSYLVPKLNTFLDLGSQAFANNVTSKSQYFLWGVNFQWDLFAAGQNKYKIKQAEASRSIVSAQYSQAERAYKMQSEQAYNNYLTAVSNYKSAVAQLSLSDKYYNDQMKLYKEGQLLYIELLDAFNQLTNNKLQLSISRAAVWTAIADLERKQATYNIQ